MPGSSYYDKDGIPITDTLVWARKFEDKEYRRIAEATLPDGKWVSTVWLGLDHNYGGNGPPLIFETMVFGSHGDFRDLDTERYSTLADAQDGHNAMVTRWSTNPNQEA